MSFSEFILFYSVFLVYGQSFFAFSEVESKPGKSCYISIIDTVVGEA